MFDQPIYEPRINRSRASFPAPLRMLRIVELVIPDQALVVLIGPSGSGKSTFAKKHFQATQIISSDYCRALVSDDENDQSATPAAFRLVHSILRERMRVGRLAVVDATNVKSRDRRPLLAMADKNQRESVAIVFDLPVAVCISRNTGAHRRVPADRVQEQRDQMDQSIGGLQREGFQRVYVLESVEAVQRAVVKVQRGSVDA